MKLLVSAVDHSANIHLKRLHGEFREDIELMGIFEKGLGNPHIDLSALAVMGFVDALKRLPFFLELSRRMTEMAKEADKVLLIDGSGFNLPLAQKIKQRNPGKEIIYYILPQAWAWKRRRIRVLERTIDTLASILPFEPGLYSKGAPITYVGHPLLDEIPRVKHRLTHTGKIAFMPGSRAAEIRRLMPVYKSLRARLNCEAVLVIPPNFTRDAVSQLYGDLSGFIPVHQAHDTLYDCDFAFVCSGTATLEAALIGTPLVLSYIARPLDFIIASRLVKLKMIGLANILFDQYRGDRLHPELIQDDVSVENLIAAYRELDREAFLEKAKQLRTYLGQGSARRVARLIEA